ncbi:hypothetical protein [Hymenobacter volaticus]|uniref:HEPN domain-containing protein n=1 Tax=Hymenobacter volaticus TaxID=2932254 RepID=A0ABY4GAI4_9BACT|nr:hypothetical protein [Hymenobacter volaticus]UOQ67911.1 hypothetical protein MUN86_08650 [Hymenobacter volaticus]
METQPNPSGRWQADLNNFFATVDRENQAFSHNLTRQGAFYSEVARPALEAAAEALRQHGRTCETGLDHSRIYLIVHRPEGPVEFQYAVVAGARIETVTPYIHCWFEENELADKADDAAGHKEEAKEDEDDKEESGDEAEGEDEGQDGKKDDKKPARTKTIELLSTWAEGREIESVTREEILADFTTHYKEAVTRLRTHLHTTPQ